MTNRKNNNELQFELITDKEVFSTSGSTSRVLEISITAPEKEQKNVRTPLNLSLVLDRSGSMSGEKLEFVKQAAAHVIDLLDEKDTASVVVYDDAVETLVTPGNLTKEFKSHAKSRIQSLRSGNSTFLSGGWLKGCENVASRVNGSTFNRALLLTDGLANVGIRDIDELVTHSREIFRRGISTSCFGVGLGYDEHLLEAMSNSGGGNFHFLETVSAIPVVFEREFNELVDIALRDTEILIKLPKGTQARVSAGWPNEIKENQMVITLGSLYAGRTQRIYVKLEIAGSAEENLSFPITVRGKDSEDYVMDATKKITFKPVPADQEEKTLPDQALMERFAEVDLADKANEALKRERKGDRRGAATLMQSSIKEHNSNMPAPMKNKYDYLASQMEAGMSEETRKRHHREEYEQKRGWAQNRDYRLRLVNGYLMTNIEGQTILIDTGIPISLGRTPEFYLLNEVHPLSKDYMGVSLDYIEKRVGTKIDILLGTDILKKYFISFDAKYERFLISSRPDRPYAESLKMDNIMGVPFVNCQIHGSDQQAFIDTGAKLSYIKEELSNGLLPIGNETDFYPGLGEFETQVYEVPFRLGAVEIQMRCGILPKLLETTLLVTGKSAIIGSELYQKQIVCLAFPEKSLLIGK